MKQASIAKRRKLQLGDVPFGASFFRSWDFVLSDSYATPDVAAEARYELAPLVVTALTR